MRSINRTALVPYTPAQMYRLVDKIEDYADFVPWCESSIVHYRDEDQVRASLVVVGAGLKKSFTTHNLLQRDKIIEIRLIDGPFKHLEGFWRFDSVAEGCKIACDLEFEFAGKLLSFAFEPVFHQMASKLVDIFCSRADIVYGEKVTER